MVQLPSSLRDIELLVLDMDGVITSESAYWDAAGLVVRDMLDSPAYLGLYPPDYTPIADLFYQRLCRGTRSDWRKYLHGELIKRCKSRGLNSNWDLAYLTAGLYITPLFFPFSQIHSALLGKPAGRSAEEEIGDGFQDDPGFANCLKENLQPLWKKLHQTAAKEQWSEFLHLKDFHLWGTWFRERHCSVAPINKIEQRIMDDFHPDVRGVRLLDELNKLIDSDPAGCVPIFGRNTPLWEECRDLFQQWYLGEDLYQKTYGCPMLYTPKPGLIHNEEPLLGKERTLAALYKLRQAGYRIGVATGRPRMEILIPLGEWDALRFFEPERIATHDEVEDAEKALHQAGIQESLGKPHPYAFIKAIHPELSIQDIFERCQSPLPDRSKVLIVGDAMADIWAAKKIDCPCAALLSGAMGEAGRRDLESAHPDIVCHDFLELAHALVENKK